MKKHRLVLEEDTTDLVCYGIKTHLSDFEIAFRINAAMGLTLERIPDHCIKVRDNLEYSFSTFVYDDELRMLQWHLISNRSHPLLLPQQNIAEPTLFESTETQTQVYLIPDFKNINFWLLIDCDEMDIAPEIKNSLNPEADITATRIHIKASKYWSNLLLY